MDPMSAPGSQEEALSLDPAFLDGFCARWKIRELSAFGSVLREDFGPDSDIDILVEFDADAPWSLFDLFDITEELKAHFGRKVHLAEKGGLRNPYRRREILEHRRILHVT